MKIDFANKLRGLAALSVVLVHLCCFFWLHPDRVSIILNVPTYTGGVPLGVHQLNYFPLGAFGVALFFLISGFVIPFSLQKQSSIPFLISRFFRIWPTYVVGLTFTLISLKCVSLYFGTHMNKTMSDIMANYFLINGFLGLLPIDYVNWTLEIEIKFYLLMAILPVMSKQFSFILVSLATLFVIINANVGTLEYAWIIDVKFSIFMITFMFIGVGFNLHFNRLISSLGLLMLTFILMMCFIVQPYFDPSLLKMGSITFNYSCALFIFWVCYITRNRLHFPSQLGQGIDFLLTKLANISYPLYIIHPIVGYSSLRIFLDITHSVAFSLILTFFFVILFSITLHYFVELPSNKLGKRIARFSFNNFGFWRRRTEVNPVN